MNIKHFILLPAVYFSMAFDTLAHATNLFVPAYFDPLSPPAPAYWSGLAVAVQTVPTTVILNPNSAFGTSVDPSYATAIDQFRHSGGKIMAYIYTHYGDRPLINIANEIDNYIAFYAIDGVFIDQMTADGTDENLGYYEQICNYIKIKTMSIR